MSLVYQILYSIKRLLRDYKPLVTKIITTLVMTTILGVAWSQMFEPEQLDKGKVLYWIEEEEDSEEFVLVIEKLKMSKKISELVEFECATSFEDAIALVNSNDAIALMKIKGDNQQNKKLEFYCKSYQGMVGEDTATIVYNIKECIENIWKCQEINYKYSGSLEMASLQFDSVVDYCPVIDSEQTSAMQYYALAMLLMLILYGAEYGSIGIGEDYLGAIGDRLKMSPIKPYQQYIGKILGMSLVVCVEAAIIITFTKLVYGVNWGNNYLLLALVIFSNAFMITAMGAMFTILTKDLTKADTLCTIMIIGFTFLAGGFFAIDLGVFMYLSPSYYARTAINTLVFGGEYAIVYKNVAVLWGITVVVSIISLLAIRRKEA